MNEPEQNQPINPDEGQEAAGAAPVSSSSPSDQSAQPEFGQYNQPEYGAMSNQYPANYNPYMYGAPDQPKPADDAQQTAHGRRRIRICRTGIRRIHMMHRDGSNQASPMAISMDQINTGQASMGRIHTNSPAYIPSTRMIPARTPCTAIGIAMRSSRSCSHYSCRYRSSLR